MPDGSDSWNAWIAAHGAELVLFARQWAPRQDDAEDIVQDGLIRFWRGTTQPRSTGYLYYCVRMAALDTLRRNLRRSRRESRAEHAQSTAMFACPLEEDETRRTVEMAIGGLPAEQREVVVLKIWGGLTFAQIGEALEVSPNTAASRYRYAIEALRHMLDKASKA